MPKLEIYKSELDELLGKKLDLDTLRELFLMNLKADIETEKDGILSVKFEDTNRPDLWSVEGVSRQLRTVLGIEKGLKKYKLHSSNYFVTVDKSISKIRPFIACAVVKNLKLNEIAIKSIMQLQDKLDVGQGRKRSKTSIGFYNLDLISFPIAYTTCSPESINFVPLGFDSKMSAKQILKEHPKGIEYGTLISSHSHFPVLIDSKGEILSMPPVINSNDLGKIDENSENILVEVTGTNKETVDSVLNLVASALAERNGNVFSVTIRYPDKKEVLPSFKNQTFEINPKEFQNISGIEFDNRQLKHLLEKFGYGVEKLDTHNNVVELEIPFYRTDILHPVDVFEDILISFGYNEIESLLPKFQTVGRLSKETHKLDNVRDLMIGAGFQEKLSFLLIGKELLFNKKAIELENPISSNYNVLRNSLLPEMLNFLFVNKTVKFPQKVFETGPVILPDSNSENKTKQENLVCAAITHSKVNFGELKSVLDALMMNLGKEYSLKNFSDPKFIDGRCGEIIVNTKLAGIFGEIHPETLNNFKLENPVIVFELNVDEL